MAPKLQPVATRLAAKTNKQGDTDSCWLWEGYITPRGYGQINGSGGRDGKKDGAHRAAFGVRYGYVPPNLHHVCGVKHCVNPVHLVPVGSGEHARIHGALEPYAAGHRAQTHCKHGHEFTSDNTYLWMGRFRVCRACKSDRDRKRRAK